jgi:hypothetical protein
MDLQAALLDSAALPREPVPLQEEDATSADGLTEGGGSGPSQRCTGRLFLHASHKQSADTPLALHSEVLRFWPIDSEVAQRPQARENFSHSTSESVRFLQNQAIPGIIPKGTQNCGLPPETVSEHIPQLSCSVLARKAVFFRGVTFDPSGCCPAAITQA